MVGRGIIAVALMGSLVAADVAQGQSTGGTITRSEPYRGNGLPETVVGPQFGVPPGGVPDDMVVVLDEYGPQVVEAGRLPFGSNTGTQSGLGMFGSQQTGGVGGSAYCGGDQARQYRFGVFGELLYLQAGAGANIEYAVPVSGIAASAQPVGGLGTLNSDYQVGFRAGGILVLDSTAAVIGTYTRWEGTTSSAVSTMAPNVIRSLVTAPGLATTSPNSQSASAEYDIQMQLVDLDYRREVWRSTNISLDGIVGARYAELTQAFSVDQVFGPVTTTVSSDIDFTGIGLRVGGEGETRPFGGGFLLYGRALLDVLFGKFDANYTQANTLPLTQAFITFEEDRTVPIAELELGVGYSLPVYSVLMRFTAGYHFSAWFNTVTTNEFIDSVQSGSYLNATDTLTFDGIVGRLEVVF
ncbi:MAG: Lpg1974 family pore-forming outer membrane protein [Planctomycetia bacterium]|nr:Lpg1974 family pore-forming outer membrane protein [Planctomycetia bacterium]